MTSVCRWRVYVLRDDHALDALQDRFNLDECFDVIACENVATQEFTWSTQRLRDVYKASSTPVCDEHLEDFKRSDRLSVHIRACAERQVDPFS